MYQSPNVPNLVPRDGVPVHGVHLDEQLWEDLGGDPLYLFQELAEPPNTAWPQGTDHIDSKGHGIAEDVTVRNDVLGSLVQALLFTF